MGFYSSFGHQHTYLYPWEPRATVRRSGEYIEKLISNANNYVKICHCGIGQTWIAIQVTEGQPSVVRGSCSLCQREDFVWAARISCKGCSSRGRRCYRLQLRQPPTAGRITVENLFTVLKGYWFLKSFLLGRWALFLGFGIIFPSLKNSRSLKKCSLF